MHGRGPWFSGGRIDEEATAVPEPSANYIPGLGSVHQIVSGEITDGTITAADLAAGSVDSSEIATDAVGSAEIATDAVGAAEIAADAVDAAEIATDAVRAAEIQADAVGSSEIATGAVDTAEILDGAIVSADLANTLVKYTKVSLSAANINGMFAAPVTLIAAPAAGKVILVHGLVFTITRTATSFANGGAVSIEYATGADDVVATIASTVITGAAGTTVTTRVSANVSDIAAANIQAKAIQITNATAAFDTGTGTAVVELWYSIADCA